MLKSLSQNTSRAVIDAVNVVAGLALVLSPWLLDYTSEASAAWNAWITGGVIALVAAGALVAFHEAEEWANAGLGAWAVISPWVVGFADLTPAVAVHTAVGLIVGLLAILGTWWSNNRPLSAA